MILFCNLTGMVRIWRIGKQSQTMEASMKDHKGPVNCIVIKKSTDDECVSASSDGSCIIWDLRSYRRSISMFANTFFMSVCYHPDESQIVTTGTDRKVRHSMGHMGVRLTCSVPNYGMHILNDEFAD